MNHQQALEEHATERYLLGEMAPEERRAFEEHYLECPECLEAVTFGADFMEAGRQVALEDKSMRVSTVVPTWRERLLAVVSGGLARNGGGLGPEAFGLGQGLRGGSGDGGHGLRLRPARLE